MLIINEKLINKNQDNFPSNTSVKSKKYTVYILFKKIIITYLIQ